MQWIDIVLAGLMTFGHWMDSDDVFYVVLGTATPVIAFVIGYTLAPDRDGPLVYVIKVQWGVGILLAGDWLAQALSEWMASVEVACNSTTHDASCIQWSPDLLALAVMIGVPLAAIAMTGVFLLGGLHVRPFFVGFFVYFVGLMTALGAGVFLGHYATMMFFGLLLVVVVLVVSRIVSVGRQGELDGLLAQVRQVVLRVTE